MTRIPQFGNRFIQLAKQSINRKECPICSHCKILGYTVDKCYKLLGYPLGFKFTRNKTTPHSANYVHEVNSTEEFSQSPQQFSPQLPITYGQFQQLMSMLKQYSPMSFAIPSAFANTVDSMQNLDHLFSKMTGGFFFS
jgi:hypothetical protein